MNNPNSGVRSTRKKTHTPVNWEQTYEFDGVKFDARKINWLYGLFTKEITTSKSTSDKIEHVKFHLLQEKGKRGSCVVDGLRDHEFNFNPELLNWMDGDEERSYFFIVNYIQKFKVNPVAVGNAYFYGLNTRDLIEIKDSNDREIIYGRTINLVNAFSGKNKEAIISFFDLINCSSRKKQNICDMLRDDFSKQKFLDADRIQFFDKKDDKQMTWLKEYLRKKATPWSGSYYLDKDGLSGEQTIKVFLSYLDSLSPLDREIFLKKILSAAYQNKFKVAGKDKKKFHLPLTKVAKKQLSELADILNKKEHVILEELIADRYGMEALDENGRKKYEFGR